MKDHRLQWYGGYRYSGDGIPQFTVLQNWKKCDYFMV